MLIFTNLEKKEYELFYNKHPLSSFMQSVQLGNLKDELGCISHYVGVKQNNKIVAAALILEEKCFLGYKSFYAPRGFLIDYHNKELLTFFTTELKKYVKKHKGFRIIIDPNLIYRIRNNDGSIMDHDNKDNESFNNLISLKYKHFGFNTHLEALQVRFAVNLKLDKPYEVLKNSFSKSTRKNIDFCYKKGLQVRKGNIEDLKSMTELFTSTAKRKNFHFRNIEYYVEMYKYMKDLMTIYIAYIDPDVYLKCTMNSLEEAKKQNEEINKKMKKDTVGSKLKNQKETIDNLINKYQEELKMAKAFKKDNPKGKDVAALLSIKSGSEYLTLTSGSLEEYRKFTPKYAMYDNHIKDAYKMGFKAVNFYGISGCFDKTDSFYGIFEFKKGFGGNVIEYIGQFELKVSSFYYIYNFLKKIKKLFKSFLF